MNRPEITGIHHLKFPVSDLTVSRGWYERVLGFEVAFEFPDDDGIVRGVAGTVPGLGDVRIALRQNPDAARGGTGFDPVCFAIADHAAAEAWAAWLDEQGVKRSPVVEATSGWGVGFADPDGLELRLYSLAEHGIDMSGRPGYGRPVDD